MHWTTCEERFAKAKQHVQTCRALIETSRLRLDAASLLTRGQNHVGPGRGLKINVVQNPTAILQRYDRELWMYFSRQGDRHMAGWYVYYSRGEDECTQLWGPFAERDQAEIYAVAYYCAMPQRWTRRSR